MDDNPGRDIGPDEISAHDLEMDLAIEDASDDDGPNGTPFYSVYNSSQENNISSLPPGYTQHQVYGTNRTVWTPFIDEPLDMTPPNLNPSLRSDAAPDPLNIMEYNPLYKEIIRLQTFDSKWPPNAPITSQDLARNGFYYIGPGDRVQCVFCNGVLKKWAYGDSVEEEHRRHFPHCPIHSSRSENMHSESGASLSGSKSGNDISLAHSDSMGIMPNLNDETGYEVSSRENLGVVQNKPKHPRFAIESDRLATFTAWPSQMKQKPEDLAKAGLFYLGKGDKVKCFSCDGMLHSWEPSDDPMSEHARWFPGCAFVKLVQGDSSSLQNGRTVADDNESVENSAAVQALVDNGYSLEAVGKAIERLHIDGVNESTIPPAEEILKTILETDCAPISTKSNVDTPVQNGHSLENDQEVKALIDENRELKDQRLCKICLENEISVIFLPCGHLACCRQCGTSLKECPICRTVIRGTAKAFWA